MHVTHTKKIILRICPVIECIVCGDQLWESNVFENGFISEIGEGDVGI